MPKLVDHVEYRKVLLNSAFSLFAEFGFDSLPMKRLAEGLEVSTGTLYHYFSSKEDLFQKMLEQVSFDLLTELGEELLVCTSYQDKLCVVAKHLASNESKYIQLYLVVNDYIRLVGVGNFQSQGNIGESMDSYLTTLCEILESDSLKVKRLLTYVLGIITTRVLYPKCFPIEDDLQKILGEIP